jgi:hypothetical protein
VLEEICRPTGLGVVLPEDVSLLGQSLLGRLPCFFDRAAIRRLAAQDA